MLAHELKTIELLLNSIVNQSDINRDIKASDLDYETFISTKNNLFNELIIRDFIAYYHYNPNFNLEEFYNNAYNSYHKDSIATPHGDPITDYQAFFYNLYNALRVGNYIFDSENNIFVGDEHIECTIPTTWLYRINSYYKKDFINEIYFYNKNKKPTIRNEQDLEKYLYSTKVFEIEALKEKGLSPEKEIDKTAKVVESEVDNQKEVKVNDIINLFRAKLDPNHFKINKVKIDNELMNVIRRVTRALGDNFYKRSINAQKEIISDTITEFLHSNIANNRDAEKYLTLLDLSDQEHLPDVNIQHVLLSLLNLYFDTLKQVDFSMEDLDTDLFRIEEYVSGKTINEKKAFDHTLSKLKDNERISETYREEIKEKLKTIAETKQSDSNFKLEQVEMSQMLGNYSRIENVRKELEQKRNRISQYLQHNSDSAKELESDSTLFKDILLSVPRNGNIYFKPNSRTEEITFIIKDNNTGKATFRASIPLEELLLIIENINYDLPDDYKKIVSF
jgi:hypothetical protein